MSDAFLRASSLRKANLAFKKGIPHTSGNITYEERVIEQFNELGRKPTQVESYAYTHMDLKDVTEAWVSEEAQERLEDYQNRLREKNGLSPDAPVDQVEDHGLEIWQETVGGVNRGRLIGRPGERWSKRGVSRDYQAYVDTQESAKKWKKLEKDNKRKAKREAELYDFITYQNTHMKQMGEFMQALAQKCDMEAPSSMFLRPPPPPPPSTCSRDHSSSLDRNDPTSSYLDESDESDESDKSNDFGTSDEYGGNDGYDFNNESISYE